MDGRNADAPLAAEGSMVPSGTPGSFIAAARQCRSDRQRQHISAAYPRSTLPWQHSAVVRSRAAGRGNISPWCVFGGGPVVARLCRGAFSGGDPWHFFRFMRSRRGLGREKRQFVAAYRRHASKMSWLRQDMRAVHPKSPANGRSGIHRAKILPRRGPFRCACPSDHARRADLAVVRRLNEKGSGKAKKLPAFWQEHVQK